MRALRGFTGLYGALRKKIKSEHEGYKQYSLKYTPLHISAVVSFLSRQSLKSDDLVVVPQAYKNILAKRFLGNFICSLDKIDEEQLNMYSRLLWASERVDRGMKIARSFYAKGKKVKVMRNTGPARVWMHDHVKEKVLVSEFEKQTSEGIQKFGHGIGADFGNLLQIIDNSAYVEGDFVEIGCFMGSSTCVMVSYMLANNIRKKFFVYDYFDGFTYEEAKNSVDDTWQNTHKTDGKEAVEKRVFLRLGGG